jgi:hypothetical protein
VVGCKLTYKDVNVTMSMPSGLALRVCNSDWLSFAAFDRVAVIKGIALPLGPGENMPELQAMALLQLLWRVDPSITLEWAGYTAGLAYTCQTDSAALGKQLVTPNGTRIMLKYWCGEDAHWRPTDVLGLQLRVLPDGVSNALQVLPALDLELVAALRNLKSLTTLVMDVGSGTLLPQLASLASLEVMELYHYCLQGPLTENLFTGMPKLRRLVVTPASAARQANDPNGGVCGINGRLPNKVLPPSDTSTELVLSYNQLTGQLPLRLLDVANVIELQGNKISGSIPAGTPTDNTTTWRVESLDLSDNSLQVWWKCRSFVIIGRNATGWPNALSPSAMLMLSKGSPTH